jgi:histone arginine demethylase JMJD6
VPRIDYSTSRREFIRLFEDPNLPCVITGALEDWNLDNFSIEKLAYMYRHEKFKVGEDDDGKTVYMGLKYYLHYALQDEFGAKIDDSPLYIFDPTFGKRTLNHSSRRSKKRSEDDEEKHRYSSESSQATCHIVDDYKVPKYFTDDIFKLAGARRPPFRWLVIGPSRSGTGIHLDPLGTSAWNALISGHKRWVLFPPGTDKSIVDPKLKDDEASTWFTNVYPKFIQKNENGITLGEKLGMIDLIQKPGETVFVPGGWYHLVMNLGIYY